MLGVQNVTGQTSVSFLNHCLATCSCLSLNTFFVPTYSIVMKLSLIIYWMYSQNALLYIVNRVSRFPKKCTYSTCQLAKYISVVWGSQLRFSSFSSIQYKNQQCLDICLKRDIRSYAILHPYELILHHHQPLKLNSNTQYRGCIGCRPECTEPP